MPVILWRDTLDELNRLLMFCSQSISFYIGLVQVAAALLTIVTYIFVLLRRRTKKNVKKQRIMSGFVGSKH